MRALLGELTHEQREVCRDWHGGLSSSMYAVASTGDLTTGTVRPSIYDEYRDGLPVGRLMTDDEWRAELAYGLVHEVNEALGAIAERPDDPEWADDVGPLTELADLAERSGDHWQAKVEAAESEATNE